jgi:indole-3-glycerol phosphate synthase
MQGAPELPGILESIIAVKREELSALRVRSRELERNARLAPPPRGFLQALHTEGSVSLIAECKRRSPGAGDIRPGLDPIELTRGYERSGASALSVLTDSRFFGGSNEDLASIRAARGIPILRKDFTLDPLHVVEARACGADAVLLIVRILGDAQLRELLEVARALDMEALVEAHDTGEIERAVDAGARVLGINNRDLATFTTDLETTVGLLERVPDDVLVVSESGIRTRDDVERLGAAGVDAILVGETLLRDPDPEAAAGRLSGVAKEGRYRG